MIRGRNVTCLTLADVNNSKQLNLSLTKMLYVLVSCQHSGFIRSDSSIIL